ncbi:MAG: hypothetical protein KAQ83_04860, partial [Nanoarchaeota archaeon]|nr:hypothetical protein [Nanoarchaeota archaeon]
MYEFGKQILEQENKQLFFEQVTVDLMGMNSGIPFTGLNFKCLGGPMQWMVSDVNKEIRESLKSEIPKIRVKNSDYIPFLADESVYEDLREYDVDDIAEGNRPKNVPEDSYEYFHYLFDINYKTEDLKVGFNYLPEYGSILKVRPSSNGIMKSNVAKGNQFLSFLCLHLYHFSYDLNYPIEVMVRDDDTDNGEGFVLRYAMPVMIDHNLPNREKATQSIFEYQQQNYDYQEQCDYLTGDYTFIARGYDDYLYESELEDVSLFYDCARYECLLGNTSFESGASYNLEKGLPGCNGGFIHAVKPGYLETSKQVLREDKESGIIEFWMPKLKEYNFSIVTIDYDGTTGLFSDIENNYNGTASVHLVLDGMYEEIKITPDDNKISLLVEPAKTYTLEIMLIGEDEQLIGGYQGNWTVSYTEQKDKDEIVF